ncbi:MAG TPA: DMT family transporter [Candidatus Limnocylindria bacterium]|nr:DMT family transporter [Candidatus Limnocylindria bacterium]
MTTNDRGTTNAVSGRDLGLLLFLGAVWGGAYLFMRVAAPQAGPLWTAEIRIGLAAIILLAVTGPRTWRTIRGRALPVAAVGLTFSAIPFSLISFATLTLPTGLAALLNAATPMFTALVAAAFIGLPLTRRAVAGMGLGIVAVLVLVGWSPLPVSTGTLVAVAAALAAALSYAVGGTLVRRYLTGMRGVDVAAGQLTSGALILLPLALLTGPLPALGTDAIASLIGLATMSTALAWPIFFRVSARTTPTVASTATFVVPAFGILWGALVLAEPIGPELIAGFGLVMVSLVLVLGLPIPSPARMAQRVASAPALRWRPSPSGA